MTNTSHQAASKALFPQGASVFLDLFRFSLAAIVALGHLTQGFFQSDWDDLSVYGVQCVGAFFVLSGFTIRAMDIQAKRVFQPVNYLADRAARLLSVAIPALALTVVCDAITRSIAPDYYAAYWGMFSDKPLVRILANLLMYNQAWGMQIIPLSNSPFWSLGYEAGFYVLWGACLHASRNQGSALLPVAVALIYGPNILFMLPLWLLGVLLFDAYQTGFRSLRSMLLLAGSIALAIGLNRFEVQAQEGVMALFQSIHVRPGRIHVDLMIGAFYAIPLMMLMLHLTSRGGAGTGQRHWVRQAQRVARRLGESTFPLYLFHLPLLIVTHAVPATRQDAQLLNLGIMAAIIVFSYLVVPPLERLKRLLKRVFTTGFVYAL